MTNTWIKTRQTGLNTEKEYTKAYKANERLFYIFLKKRKYREHKTIQTSYIGKTILYMLNSSISINGKFFVLKKKGNIKIRNK